MRRALAPVISGKTMAASVLGEAFAPDRFAGVKRPFGEAFPPIASRTGRAEAGTRFSLIHPGLARGSTMDAMWFIESDLVGPGPTKYAIGGWFPRETAARGGLDALAPEYFERRETTVRADNDALERRYKGLLSPSTMPGRIQPALASIAPILGRWFAERAIANT